MLDAQAVQPAAETILANGVPSVVAMNVGWTDSGTLKAMSGQDLDDAMTPIFTASAHLCLARLPVMRADSLQCNFVIISSIIVLAISATRPIQPPSRQAAKPPSRQAAKHGVDASADDERGQTKFAAMLLSRRRRERALGISA